MSDLDDFMKEIGAPANLGTGKPNDPAVAGAQPPPSAASGSGSTGSDVLRGVAKSGAGTLVAIPRLANQAIGLVSPSTSSELGTLAEKVPGVKRLESFADSPNETTGESLGYWGGEIGQAFLPTEWLKGLQYGGKLADLARGAKSADRVIDANEMFKAGRATKAAAAATKAAPAATAAEEPFVSTGVKEFDDLIKSQRAARTAGETEAGRTIQANQSLLREQAARADRRGVDFIEDRPPERWPYRGLLPRAGRAAGVGALQGAISDPQDPMTGAVTGAATGGLAPLAGAALRSPMGQWMAGHGARSSAMIAANAIAAHLGIPHYVLWGLSIPQLLLFWHSPFARRLDALARQGARRGGTAMVRSTGRAGGLAGGTASQTLNDTGWMPQVPGTQEPTNDQQDQDQDAEPQAQAQ